MTYGIIVQVPEAPISEKWTWETDIATSYDGTEDSAPLLRYPRRSFEGTLQFDDVRDLRRHVAMMTARFKTEFDFPLYQYLTKLKSPVAAGADTVSVNAKRSNFRVGGAAIIMEGATFEEVEVAAVTDTTVQFADVLANSYTKRAFVAPVVTVYSESGAAVTRVNPDHSATSSFSFKERLPTIPFVSPLNDAVIPTFDGLPLCPHVPIGTSFEQSVATGLEVADNGAIAEVVSPWNFEQWLLAVRFKADLFGNADEFEWWQLFADTIQGSANPFLLPTNRSDFEIVTAATNGGVWITVDGDEYSQHYWGHGSFSRIFIDTDAGRHYAKVTGITAVGGNDRLTFTPALPAGAGWLTNQKLGFVLKVRNDNDVITCNHYGLRTEIEMAVRTVL